MKVSFFHDCRIKTVNNRYYVSGGLNDERLKFYTDIFGTMKVIARQERVNNAKGLMEVKSSLIKFSLIENINYIKLYLNNRKDIEKEVMNSDLCVIRLPSTIGNIAYKYAKKHNKIILIELVGCVWSALWNHSIKGKIVAPFYWLLTSKYVKNAQYVTYVTKKFLQKRYPTKGKSIDCSDVELDENSEEVISKRVKKINNLDIERDKIKIGLVGSLNVNYKGHDSAIKAIKILKRKFKNIELHFVGNGNQEKWRKVAKENNVDKEIIFDGTIPHENIKKWFDDIDIYVIPSLTEGMPRALIEAMSRGCPCIGTKVGGIPELLNEHVLIKKKQYKQLAIKIEELILNKEKMLYQSNKNFVLSNQYQKQILDKKRKEFYKSIYSKEI